MNVGGLTSTLTHLELKAQKDSKTSLRPIYNFLKLSAYETQCMLHYENMPMQYTEIFKSVKIEKFLRRF